MKKTALLLMIVIIASKVFGFAREITLAHFYGTSQISDAFLISLTIPAVIFSFFGTAIKTTYIPLSSEILKDKKEKEANLFTSNIITTLMIVCTIIVVVVQLFPEAVVTLFARSFEGESMYYAVKFTRITILSIYFTAMIHVLNGYLNLKNSFLAPELIGIPMSLILMLTMLLSSIFSPDLLGYGKIIAVIVQLLVLLPFLVKKGFKYTPTFNLKDPRLQKLAFLTMPVMFGTSINQINKLVDRNLASEIIGGVSALNYAYRLNGFINGIFVISIATVMYPMIARMASDGDLKGLKKTLSESVVGISLLVFPATVGAMIFAEPIIDFLFGRGEFGLEAIKLTSTALFFYSIGMVAFGMREILSRVFFSLQDTKTPMVNASIAVGLNVVLNIILFRFLGIGGLALATSVSAIFCSALLIFSLKKKIGRLGMKNIFISFGKIVFAACLMGVVAKVVFELATRVLSINLSLIISIGVGALVYFGIIFCMKINEVDVLSDALKDKLKGRLNGINF
ncbi:murein biosynthesis integral membrane protein MurJ [Proteinivorax hydrogeniformans]|uniref:Probable lipid II flippase MurJ n=1 Tax=Proteinivorax hydrogeniformans TaxID=1826727 RepID=A0AAU8HX06_9FIRM